MAYLYHQREPRVTLGEPGAAPAPAPTVPVLTGPTSIRRGERGDYVVTNAPPGATFSHWMFISGPFVFRRSGNNNVPNWSGTMVQSGFIGVSVTDPAGRRQNLQLRVTVTPRPWTENASAIPLVRTGNGSLPAQPRLGRPGRDPRDPGLGTSQTSERHTLQTKVVSGGPNDGFNFVESPPVTWTTLAFTSQALYDPSHPFFRAHDPMRRGLPLPGGRLQIGTIQKNVEAHEGIIAPPHGAPAGYASHHQALLNYLRAHPINRVVERDVSHISREPNLNYATRINGYITRQTQLATAASQPHPKNIFPGPMYFNYPFITPRTLRIRVGTGTHQLNLTNPAGKARWASTNPAIATVDARGIVRPVAQGRAIIRVTNADGDTDEIPVTVDP